MVLGGKSSRFASREDAMLGVRFSAVCAIITTIVATPAGAAIQTNRQAAAKVTSADRATAVDRSRRLVRHRHGTRHAHSRQRVRQAAGPSERPAIATAANQEPSTAARRFREFVGARSLAANPVEELRRPRMDAWQFSGQTAYPLGDGAAPQPVAEPGEPVRAASANAVHSVGLAAEPEHPRPEQQTSGAAGAGTANSAPEAGSRKVAEIRSADHDSSKSYWVRLVFLTWGGLLTVGSALRMLIG
jgi:hypothetical protein